MDKPSTASPADKPWARLRRRIDEFVQLIVSLRNWWKAIVAVAAVITVLGGTVLAFARWVDRQRQCSASAAQIREATAYADWCSVSALVSDWEQDCRDCSRELDLEVNLYKALSEGGLAGAQAVHRRLRNLVIRARMVFLLAIQSDG